MCGIIGYHGKRNALHTVLKGLKKLEYRGYDSWGITVQNEKGDLRWPIKNPGKVSEIEEENIAFEDTQIGMGHTRWATMGQVTRANAHPQWSKNEEIMVVHNGIIENFQELKKELKNNGFRFVSETDTEVIPHLIEYYLSHDLSTEDAFINTLTRIKGSYAILMIRKNDKRIFFAKDSSPLCLGIGKGELFLASDVSAFLEYTKNVIFLEDRQWGFLEASKFKIFDLGNGEVTPKIEKINWTLEQAEKGNYPHFMLKEIMEQQETIVKSLQQDEETFTKVVETINNAYGLFLVGCGTAGYTAQVAEYLFARISNKHVNVLEGSEFPYFSSFLTNKSVMIVVSQSGETADLIQAIKTAKQKGVTVIGIVNVMGSTVMRMADYCLLTNAGPEIAVASTKATTAQLTLWTLLSYACAGKTDEGKQLLLKAQEALQAVCSAEQQEHIKKISKHIAQQEHHYVIGRGTQYPLAKEGALKIKEVSYVHAEGMSGGELKHGTIALIEQGTPVTVLVAEDETKADILSNAAEIKARGGYIIGIAHDNNELFDAHIPIPDVGNATALALLIPLQLLAYFLAVERGCDVDQPRNLAKSVTVK